jgi:hypothetical protein
MKVLKNNFDKIDAMETINPYPRKHECLDCGSELEYDKSDIYIGVYGASHIKCPLCGYENMLDDNENNLKLTKSNIEFPIHFAHHNNGLDVCNNEIKKYINEAIEYFRRNKEADYCYYGTGNTMVYVFRLDGDEEYEVVVTKDYYDTYIPFEKVDYGMTSGENSIVHKLNKKEW